MQEEQRRVMVLATVREGRLMARQAAHVLGISLRHIRRLLATFRRLGPAGLAHGNRGRPPHNRLPRRLQRQVIRLARTTYAGFNHQHFTELLAEEHHLHLSRRTIRRWLLTVGLASPRPRRPPRHRRRRERMPRAGLMLQWDGSHHDWLQGRGPRLVLHAAVDDATGEVPAAIFRDQEDAYGYFVVLRDTIRRHGIPVALYGDRHGIVTAEAHQRPLTIDEQLQGRAHPLTQLGRALAELHITWIPASTPQATDEIVKPPLLPRAGIGS